MRKRLVIVALFLILACANLFAGPRFFIGASFNYDANYLAKELADKLDVIDSSVSYPAFDGDNVKGLQGVGPKFELVVFPFSIPLGIGVTSTTLFTVGYMTGGKTEGYFSREIDFRQDVGVNLFYQQAFGDTWGLFADIGLVYSWYRIATTNQPNSKADVDYIRFSNWGIGSDLGVYLEHNGTFFKVGAVLYYDLEHAESFGFRYGMTVGGGIAFGK